MSRAAQISPYAPCPITLVSSYRFGATNVRPERSYVRDVSDTSVAGRGGAQRSQGGGSIAQNLIAGATTSFAAIALGAAFGDCRCTDKMHGTTVDFLLAAADGVFRIRSRAGLVLFRLEELGEAARHEERWSAL